MESQKQYVSDNPLTEYDNESRIYGTCDRKACKAKLFSGLNQDCVNHEYDVINYCVYNKGIHYEAGKYMSVHQMIECSRTAATGTIHMNKFIKTALYTAICNLFSVKDKQYYG